MPQLQKVASKTATWPVPWRREARRLLLKWFRHNARELAWRKTRDPYSIWVSEIMLQQTQVATVERFYPRFLTAFPTIAALAAATEHDVLRLWEGLGYYRRARQLHAAAKKIVAEHGGQFPRELEPVRQLPGIGRYTAGAILSIAFDMRHPILEANTIRLLSRLVAYRGDTASAAGQTLLWKAAETLLAKQGNGELNQALMELGSLVCTPRNPKCEACPLETLCPTRRAGLQNEIPAARRQPVMEDVREAAVIVQRRGKVLLRKCADGERWAGLWDFPRFSLAAKGEGGIRKAEGGRGKAEKGGVKKTGHKDSAKLIREVMSGVQHLTKMSVTSPAPFTTLRHGVTRFRITLLCFTADCLNTLNWKPVGEFRWVKPRELHEYPLSVTGRKLAKLLVQTPVK